MTGVCVICGPVKIKFQHKDYYRCENAPRRARDEQLKQLYGISLEEFERMVADRLSQCDICHRETKLHVDHDHATGVVRGLLCGSCNRGIGLLQESPDVLANAIKYLED